MPEVTVDYKSAFKNAGLDFSKIEAKGVLVKMSTAGMKFHLDGEVLTSLPFAPAKVAELAVKFDPKNQSHLSMKSSLQQAFNAIEAKVVGGAPTIASGKGGPFGSPTPPKSSPTFPSADQPTKIVHGDVEVFPADKMKTANAVGLATASMLFQPVGSTSPGSRYYVVGVGEGVMVAARVKGGQLSVRVEGTAFAKMSQKIQEAGVFGPKFAGSFEANYASMHLNIDGKKEAARVVGAVLASLAPYIKHPTPDLQPLMEAA